MKHDDATQKTPPVGIPCSEVSTFINDLDAKHGVDDRVYDPKTCLHRGEELGIRIGTGQWLVAHMTQQGHIFPMRRWEYYMIVRGEHPMGSQLPLPTVALVGDVHCIVAYDHTMQFQFFFRSEPWWDIRWNACPISESEE